MASTKRGTVEEEELEFVEDLPPKQGRGKYTPKLLSLMKFRHRWALIATTETPIQAQNLQHNLSQRHIKIPASGHNWEFAARGCEVFAQYQGPARGAKRRS